MFVKLGIIEPHILLSLNSRLTSGIRTMSSADLRAMVETRMHPVHAASLRHVMAHLCRVWAYQHVVIGCHYLPDKLFHIFRSILMRPPWTRILSLVDHIDRQSLVIQRLMLECDWNVQLPDYKVRVKRVLRDPSAHPHPHPPAPPLKTQVATKENDKEKESTKDTGRAERSARKMLCDAEADAEAEASLQEVQWYWGSISRDETILILKNCPDGSFLVRRATHSPSSIKSTAATDMLDDAPYTLCVMKSNSIRVSIVFDIFSTFCVEQK